MNSIISTIFFGGFAKGYRTHIAGLLLVIDAVAHYATGDLSLVDLSSQLPTLAAGLGIVGGRAALQELIDVLKALAPVLAQPTPEPTPAPDPMTAAKPVAPGPQIVAKP